MPARAFPLEEPIESSNGRKSNPAHTHRIEPPKPPQLRITTVDLGLFNGRKPVVVGIDQSLENFAVAAWSPKDETAFLWLCHPGDHGVRRLLNIQFFVTGVFQQLALGCGGAPLHVTMENYSFGSPYGREKLGECGATTKLALVRSLGQCNEVAYPTLVTPYQLQKFCLGPKEKGVKRTKSLVLKGVYRKWGVDLTDDNLADAYTLARVAGALAAGSADLAYERDVIGALERHTEWDIQPKPRKRSRSSGRVRSQSSE
jgi:hypothetical protein